MNEGPVLLLNWVEENIHPRRLTNLPLINADLNSLKAELSVEVKSFRKTLFKQLIFSKKEAAASMIQLVKVSNTVQHYLYRMSPVWNKHPEAYQIKPFYFHTLGFLETLIEDLGRLAPKIRKHIPITQYSLPDLRIELRRHYRDFILHLEKQHADADLKALVQNGISQLVFKKEITLANIDYCRDFMSAIINGTSHDTETFKSLLCLSGFNAPEFYLYCINDFKISLNNIPGLHEQLEMVINEQDKLNSLPVILNIKMLPGVAPIGDQLEGFLAEKRQYIKQMLKLRRVILQDDQLAKSMLRLKINMPVAQFGLFIRVQIEKGLLLKENIGELFNFFATHFYTPQTMFISAESLRKKSTEVEFTTAQKLKAHLIAMLNWLNENYNLSNYKGS